MSDNNNNKQTYFYSLKRKLFLLIGAVVFALSSMILSIGGFAWFALNRTVDSSSGSITIAHSDAYFESDATSSHVIYPNQSYVYYMRNVQSISRVSFENITVTADALEETDYDFFSEFYYLADTGVKFDLTAETAEEKKAFFESNFRSPLINAIKYKFVIMNAENSLEDGTLDMSTISFTGDDWAYIGREGVTFYDNTTNQAITAGTTIATGNTWKINPPAAFSADLSSATGLALVIYFDPDKYVTAHVNIGTNESPVYVDVEMRNSNPFIDQSLMIEYNATT